MKPERILFVCHGHPELVPGGTELFAHDLFRAIRDEGHAQTMFLGCVSRLHRPARAEIGFQAIGRSRDELLLWVGGFDRFMLRQVVELVERHGYSSAAARSMGRPHRRNRLTPPSG